jgi:predicted acetyltransferase
MLKLIKPTIEYKNQAQEYLQEAIDNGENLRGIIGIREYDKWIKDIEDYSQGINLPEEEPPQSMYFLLRENDNKILGTIRLRHELPLPIVGHIGYEIRPSERKKGYASKMLGLLLQNECHKLGLDKVSLTCKKDNIASAKTILNNGAVLTEEIEDPERGLMQIYWIDIK